MTGMTDIAIRVENLSKRYHIDRARQRHDAPRSTDLPFTLRASLRGTIVSTCKRPNVPTNPMTDIAIRVENLSKRYHIGRAQQRHDTLRDALNAALKRLNVSTFKRSNVFL
jgi:hypothetical protein